MQTTREPVTREVDDELVGFVTRTDEGTWQATTTFDVPLGRFDDRDSAAAFLRAHGLALLARPWSMWSTTEQRWRRVVLLEAGVGWVRIRRGRDPRSTDIYELRGGDLTLLRPPSGGA